MQRILSKIHAGAVLALLLLLPSTDALAVTSELLTKECKKTSSFCLGYIIGIEDGIKYGALNGAYLFSGFIEDHSMREVFGTEVMRAAHGCWPEGITNSQRVKVFIKFMEEHPERLHEPPYRTYGDAMASAFPCEE